MRILISVVAVVAAAALAALATGDSTKATTDTTGVAAADSLKAFTLAELATFDGKDGRPAYIAVEGTVYDVTNAKGWKKGGHQGFFAGKDVTRDMAKKSPHGNKPLAKLPVVGKLVKPAAAPK